MRVPSSPRIAALLAGGLLTLAQPPAGWWWLAPVALVPLLHAALESRRPFLAGWLAGFVHFLTLLHWVYPVMTVHGALAGWLAALLTVLLAAVLGLYLGLFAWLVAWCARRRGANFALAAAPLLWVGVEILRAKGLTGFPWCPLGNALWEHPKLAWPAAFGAVWLVSLCCAGGAAGLLALMRPVEGKAAANWLIAGGVWLAGALDPSAAPSRPAASLGLRIVQPSIPQSQKWDPGFARENLARMRDLALRSSGLGGAPAVIFFPESSLPEVDPAELNSILNEISAKSGAHLLVGTEYYRGAHAYNAAVLLAPAPIPAAGGFPPPATTPLAPMTAAQTRFDLRETGFYAKRHLAPFGEYIPWKTALFFARRLTHGMGEFTPGTDGAPLPLPEGGAAGVLICYESIFPELAAESARADGVRYLVNLSNDAWFDGTGAKTQLLSMAAMRVHETGLPMIRVANTGFSGVIEPGGSRMMEPDLPLSEDFGIGSNGIPRAAAKFGAHLATIYLALAALPLLIALRRKAAAPPAGSAGAG